MTEHVVLSSLVNDEVIFVPFEKFKIRDVSNCFNIEGLITIRQSTIILRKRFSMDGNEIEMYLRALDQELGQHKLQKPVHLAVVGGVYMVCFLRNRTSTVFCQHHQKLSRSAARQKPR